ncbi:restriction endonuclease subunit S [Brevibacillus sp. MER 51]|uniref:restriction endonuclease subunit S n=1 Tax=Brevibacillus sp. MER 51 TaxID=2939560 RepID=UPI002040BC17|nr:restriction endonuclease subunit S [Brevibacillus sp. MER 51]MCM3143922.1 restriction endonuclease subunit S [Brevibacillus sp. MER 51]
MSVSVDKDLLQMTAKELLAFIKSVKERMVKEGQIRRRTELPSIADEEKPYDLPQNWEWVRLGDVGQIVGGGTPKTNIEDYWQTGEGGIPWLTPADLTDYKDTYISSGRRSITESGLRNSSTQLLPKGSVLFSSRAPIGYVAIASTNLCTNQGFKSVVPYCKETNKYLYWCLKYKAKEINENASGTTFKEVSGSDMEAQIIPLPPLAEQQRIVKILDQLSDIKSSLVEESNESLRIISEYRSIILQDGIQGKLLPQIESDEPTSVLWEKCIEQKDSIVNKKARNIEELPQITDDEHPYKLPSGWSFLRLGEVVNFIGGQQPEKSTFRYEEAEGYIRLIQIRDYKSDSFKTFVPIEKARKFCTKDDVMIGRYGPPIFQILRGLEGAYNVALIKAEPRYSILSKEYLYFLLKNRVLLELLESLSQRTAGQDGIDMKTLKSFVVGIPPVAEQERIVSKLVDIMEILDSIESELLKSKETAEKLYESLLRETFNPLDKV